MNNVSKSGQLSNADILNEKKNQGLIIKPFSEKHLKGASYDITPTVIAMSTKTGMLEKVFEDKKYPHKYYIYVKAKDTVQIVSNEFIVVPKNIAGYVVSRVSKVSEGFGHISTSIDPNWKGALLIGLSNPSNKPIKVFVGEVGSQDNPLATVSFHYLNTECEGDVKVYDGMRIDLLKKMMYTQRNGFRSFLRRTFLIRRRNFTDFFFKYFNQEKPNENNWDSIVKELTGSKTLTSGTVSREDSRSRRKDRISDYIIVENWWLQCFHWLHRNWDSIWKLIAIIFAVLIVLRILPESIQSRLTNFFSTLESIL